MDSSPAGRILCKTIYGEDGDIYRVFYTKPITIHHKELNSRKIKIYKSTDEIPKEADRKKVRAIYMPENNT